MTVYADDITILLKEEDELEPVLRCLGTYAEVAGSKVNYNKSMALWYGTGQPFSLQGHLQIAQEEIRVLGITFAQEDTSQKNWKLALEVGKQTLEKFKGVTGNVYERVQILKTYILPLFIQPAVVFPIPKDLLMPLYAMFFNYIWGNGLNRVKRGVTYNAVRDGGLTMINPEVFLSSFFLHFNVGTSLSDAPPGWATLFYNRLSPFQKVWEDGRLTRRLMLRPEKYPGYVIRTLKLLQAWEITKEELKHSSRKQLCERVTMSYFTEQVTLYNCAPEQIRDRLPWLIDKGIPNTIKTVNWYAIHNKLLVKSNIKHTALMDSSCTRATCTGVLEDQDHLFVACPFVIEFWKAFLREVRVKIPIDYQTVVYGLKPGYYNASKSGALNVLLAVAKYYIWNARCAQTWGRETMGIEQIIQLILTMTRGIVNKEKGILSRRIWARRWAWFPLDVG
ncbi:uncharacterized protein LOC135355463 [Latimeria chalumnae]|uniref:uncharacterized protein LOC135355463 n=1 Tax=Latimeria chalumnae TaxID=7897 RepID=UPI00313D4FAB